MINSFFWPLEGSRTHQKVTYWQILRNLLTNPLIYCQLINESQITNKTSGALVTTCSSGLSSWLIVWYLVLGSDVQRGFSLKTAAGIWLMTAGFTGRKTKSSVQLRDAAELCDDTVWNATSFTLHIVS